MVGSASMPASRWIAAAALAASTPACTALFPFGEPPDAAAVAQDAGLDAGRDAGTDAGKDAGDDAGTDAGCSIHQITAPIEADSEFNLTNHASNFGALPIVVIGIHVAVMRFDLSDLPAEALLQRMSVRLAYAREANDCSAPCGRCSNIDEPGEAHANFMRSDWVEAEVTWDRPREGASWNAVGASGLGMDRSDPVAHAVHEDDSDTELVVDPSALLFVPRWRDGDFLSFQIVADGAVIVAKTKERDSGCIVIAPPALDIEYCLP